MDEIRPWLFIGNFKDTLNKPGLRRNSIQAMLQLAEKVEYADIHSLYLPVEDFAPLRFDLLRQGVSYIREQKKANLRTLVACGVGINRSSAFCTAALKEEEGLSLFDAFKEVKRKHPEALPHEPVWNSLCTFYGEATPYVEVLQIQP